MNRYIEANRRLWDAYARVHEVSDFYDLDGFRAGRRQHPWDAAPGIRLHDYEVDDVGDVAGKDLLHLQCHIGTDTLSWARLGANVVGVDFSEASLEIAERLAKELDLDAKFVLSAIDDLAANLEGSFDIVYTSRGTIWWLPDLRTWARVIATFLRPGGLFYMTDIHPFAQALCGEDGIRLRSNAAYFPKSEPFTGEVTCSYAGEGAEIDPHVQYGWVHSIGEVLTSLAETGLQIEFLHEFDWLPEGFAPYLVKSCSDGKLRLPDDAGGEVPLMYSLRARKLG